MSGSDAMRRAWAFALLAGLVSALLMSVRLGDPGYWIDEIYTARWTRLSVGGLLAALATDLHPPLFFLIERLCARAWGEGEMALRALPLLAGAATVPLAFWAFRPALGDRRALLVSWVVAFSPGFALYSRMARYYSLAALTALIAHGLFARLASGRNRFVLWAIYTLAVALALSTSYMTACLIAAHGIWAFAVDRSRRLFLGWLAAVAAAALLLAPWWLVATRQIGQAHGLLPALSGGAKGWALMLGYELHALIAGEVLFPWEPAGVVALVCGLILLVRGIRVAAGEARTRWLLHSAVVALVLASALLTVLARATPFVGLPGRTLYLWPFAAAFGVLGACTARLPGRWLGAGWVACMLVGWVHLRAADHVLNPIYLTPGREAARDIARDAAPTDAVLAEHDTGVGYYLERLSFPGRVSTPGDFPASIRSGVDVPTSVWWARLSRDGSARLQPGDGVGEWIERGGILMRRTNYGRVDPVLAELKHRLLGKPPYEHRLRVERYGLAGH